MKRLIIAAAAWITLWTAAFSQAESVIPSANILTSFDFNIAGVGLKASPEYQAVPKGIASKVNAVFDTGPFNVADIIAQLPNDYTVRAELSGPSFQTPLTLTAKPGKDFDLPTLPILGKYTLSNIRLCDGAGNTLFGAIPQAVAIESIPDPLITSVTTRPLTLEELRERGVTFDSSNFTAYEFVAGFATESGQVPLILPLFIPNSTPIKEDPPAPENLGIELPQLAVVSQPPDKPEVVVPPNLTVAPFLMEVDEWELKGNVQLPPIPGIVVIPGNIGFLHQYFSALAIVTNGAPSQSNLVIKDVKAKIIFPAGEDTVPGADAAPGDDPLRMAKGASGYFPREMTVLNAGPDGKNGTPDDVGGLRPAESGQADFTIEGLKEGTHKLDFEITATLEGLPIGPVTLKGKATGAVLVRSPDFTITMGHPATIRSGEEYDLFVIVTNTGKVPANLVSVHLDQRALSGAVFVDGETPDKNIETILPGSAATVKYRLRAQRTGKVTATAFESPEVKGRFILRTGVGELNIPLSPDSLILPYTGNLPADLITSAMGLLGQAWSVATAPAGALPADVLRIDKQTVSSRAFQLSEAGLRVQIGDTLLKAVEDFSFDFFGSDGFNRGFDDLRRRSTQGAALNRALAALFRDEVRDSGIFSFQQGFADKVSYRPGHISVITGEAPVRLRVTDASGNVTGDGSRGIPYGDQLLLTDTGGSRSTLSLLTKLDSPSYRVELTADDAASFDMGIVVPGGGGVLKQLRFDGINLPAGGKAGLLLVPGTDGEYLLAIDENGDGTTDRSIAPSSNAIPDHAPHLVAATQIVPGFGPGGDKHGRNVAVLFDQRVTRESVQNVANYGVDENAVRVANLQPGGRMAFLLLRDGIGPFFERKLTVSGLQDTAGNSMVAAETLPIRTTAQGPAAVVTGAVRSARGEPIPDATIRLFQLIWWTDPLTGELVERYALFSEKAVGPDGKFQFDYVLQNDDPQGPFMLEALNTRTGEVGSLTTGVIYDGQQLNLDIFMKARGSVSGTVKNEAGTPVANAAVQLSTLSDNRSYVVECDAAGVFSFSGVRVGPFNLKAVSAVTRSEGTIMGILPEDGSATVQDVTIYHVDTPKGNLTGRVLGPDGQTPRAGVIVIVRAPNYQNWMRTGADGRYGFSGVYTGSATVVARDDATGEYSEVLGSISGGATTVMNVILKGTGSVNGRVKRDDGKSAAGLYVVASAEHIKRVVQTDENGTFLFDSLPTGQIGVEVLDPRDFNRTVASGAVTLLADGESADIFLYVPKKALDAGTIQGTVYHRDGTVWANAEIRRLVDNFSYYQHKADSQGRFALPGLPLGSYRLAVVGAKEVINAATDLWYDTQVRELELRPVAIGTVSGVVYDSIDRVPTGADVTLISTKPNEVGWLGYETRLPNIVKSDPQTGRFTFTGINEGYLTVSSSNIFRPTPVTVARTVTAENPNVSVELILKGDQTKPGDPPVNSMGSVSGMVFMPDGSPTGENVRVTITFGGLDVTVTTDDQGRFKFAAIIPSGNQMITAFDPVTSFTWRGYVSVPAGLDVPIRINLLGRGSLTVRALLSNAPAGEGVTIEVKGSEYPHDFASGKTGPDGTIRFDNLFQGNYAVTAKGSFGRGGRASAAIPADGASSSVDVRLDPSGTITGRFLKADRKTPISGGQIRLKKDGRVIAYAISSSGPDNAGAYTLEHVPLGNFSLEGVDQISERMGLGGGRVNTDNETVVSDIVVIPWGTVRGNVLNYSGTAPVGGAEVSISVTGLSSFSYSTVTAPDGSFLFTGVPSGRFKVDARNPVNGLFGYASSTIGYEGEGATVKLNIAPSGSIEGRVFMQDGVTAAANATVALNGSIPTPVNQDTGGFRFDNLAAGSSYSLAAVETGTLRAGKRIATIISDGEVASGDIILSGIGVVRGTVYETGYNGQGLTPLAGAEVHIQARGLTSASYTDYTGADGTYRFINVPVGSFTLQAKHAEKVTAASGSGTLSREGETATVDMTLGEVASLKGRVLMSDGVTPSPAGGVSLTASNGRKYTGTTDSNGVFTFLNIPIPCSYSLYVEDVRGLGIGRSSGTLSENGRMYEAADIILDDTPLTVLDMDPVPGSVDVSLNKYVKVRFSKPVNPATVNSGTIYLLKGSERVVGGVSLDADNRGATFTSAAPFSGFTLYTLVVTTGIRDLLDRALPRTYSSSFSTIDIVSPTVLSVSPANGATEVSTTAVVRIVFSEAIDPGAVDGIKLLRGGMVVPTRTDVVQGGMVAILTPLEELVPNASYSVGITGVRDLVSVPNFMPGSVTTTFATVDITPPVITSLTIPANAELIKGNTVAVTAVTAEGDTALVDLFVDDIRVATAVKAPFTANLPLMKEGTITVKAVAQDRAGNRGLPAYIDIEITGNRPPTVEFVSPADGAVVDSGSTVTVSVKATDDLMASQITLAASGELTWQKTNVNDAGKVFTTSFALKIPAEITHGGAIQLAAKAKDWESNLSETVQRTLFVRDALAPVVSITSPGQSVKYRPGATGTGQFRATDNVGVTGISCTAAGAASGGTNLAVDPAQKDATGGYDFQVAADAPPFAEITLSCSAWDAMGNTGTSTAILKVADIVPPRAMTITPLPDRSGVSRYTAVTVKFDEPVNPASVTAELFNLTLAGAAVPGTITLAESNTLAVFTPAAPLGEQSAYTITVKAGITDPSGNALAGDRTSTFTTGAADTMKVVYYDTAYPTSWISRPEALIYRNFLAMNGFTEVDADGLREFMESHDAGSIVVMAQDVAPDTVYDTASADALVRRYLDNGGTVVWMQNAPFCYQGHYGSAVTDTCADSAGMRNVLGVGGGALDRNDGISFTAEGLKAGLSGSWTSVRPVNAGEVSRIWAGASGGAAAWRKNFNPAYPDSGFIRLWDNGGDFTSRTFLGDLLTITGTKPAVVGYPELVARFAMEGDFSDSSENGYNGVAGNGAAFTSDKVWGSSAGSFKGGSDHVAVGNLHGNFPDNTFTIEAWVKPDDTGNGARRTMAGGTGAAADYAIGLKDNQFVVFAGNGGTVNYAGSGVVPNSGQWYHVAGSYDGGRLRIYVNGELKSTVSAAWKQSNGGADFQLGGASCCGDNNFNGLLDEVAVYRHALPAETVREHYYAGISGDVTPLQPPRVTSVPARTYDNVVILTGTKDPDSAIRINGRQYVPIDAEMAWRTIYPLAPGRNVLEFTSRDASGNGSRPVVVDIEVLPEKQRNPDLVGLWHMDGNWHDFSGGMNQGYPVNGTTVAADAVYGTSAGSFPGGSGYAGIGSLYGQFPDNSFTIEAWVKAADTGNGGRRVIAGGTGALADYAIGLKENEFVAFTGDKGKMYYAYSGVIPEPGRWYHVAGTFDRGRLKIYVNGAFEFDMPAGWAQGSTGVDFRLGGEAAANNGFNGVIDEVAVYKRALTDDEIAARYGSTPRVTVSSPGQSVKYQPGEAGTVSVSATSDAAITGIYCEAKGVASGTTAAFFDGRKDVSHEFPIRIAGDAAPYAPYQVYCYARDDGSRIKTGILSMTAADVVRPEVTGASIPDGSGNQPLDPSITLSFSEAMAAASLNGSTLVLTAAADPGTAIPLSITVAADRESVTVKPAASLAKATAYLLTATTGITDEAGNAPASPHTLAFATDGTPPAVTSVSVPDNSGNLPVTQAFSISFSEPIAPASANGASVLLAAATAPDTPLALDITVAADRKSITVKPLASLERATSYLLTITTALTDQAGNGLAAPWRLNFSTDGGAPVVTAVSIPNNSGNLPVNPTVTFTLSETLSLASINSTSVLLARLSDPAQAIPASIGVSGDRKSITVRPVANLAKGTAYVVTITTGVTDEAGNGLLTPYQLNFTTDGTPPAVTGSSVPNNSGNLPLNPSITLSFNEPLAAASVTGATVLLTAAADPNAALPASLTLSGDRRSITVKPAANLVKAKPYVITVTTDVTDEAGNGLASPYQFAFTTDGAAPAVTATTPAAAAQNVPVTTAVSFTFAEPIDPTSVSGAALLLASPYGPVSGIVSVSADNRTVSFRPAAPLAYGRDYTVTLKAGIRDAAGNATAVDYSSTFRTQALPSDLAGLWRMDGDFNDASGNGNHLAAAGNVNFTNDRKGGSYSGSFAGSSCLVGTSPAGMSFTTGFTVTGWIKPGAAQQAGLIDMGQENAGGWEIRYESDQSISYRHNWNRWQGWETLSAPAGSAPPGEWTHFAVAYGDKGATLYLNGAARGTATFAYNPVYEGNYWFEIGANRSGEDEYFSGLIDEVAVYKRTLTGDEISELHLAGATADRTPPAPPVVNPLPAATYSSAVVISGTKDADASVRINGRQVVPHDPATAWQAIHVLQPGQNVLDLTSRDAAGNESEPVTAAVEVLPAKQGDPDIAGLWRMDGNWYDYSGNGNHGTAYNGAVFSAVTGNGPFSGSFAAANAYVSIADSPTLHSEEELTVTGWLYVKGFDKEWQGIFWKGNNQECTAGCENREYALWLHSTGYLNFNSTPKEKVGIGTLSAITPAQTIQPGRWYHVAAVVSSSQNYMKVYVNGQEKANWTYSRSGIRTSGYNLIFGNSPGTNNTLNGYLDEMTIFKRSLSAAEILAKYNAVPKLAVSSPGESAKYKPGETGTVTLTATDDSGISRVYCRATGAAKGQEYVSFDPSQPQVNRDFTIEVADDAVSNAAIPIYCHAVDDSGAMGSASLTLAVADVNAPTVTGASIPNNSGNLPLDPAITISFSEAMAASSVTSGSVLLTSVSDPNAVMAVTFTIASDRKSITVKPAAPLAKATTYLITVTTGVTDGAGNPLAAPYQLRFTTDTGAPTVTGSSVPDNAGNLPLNPSVTVSFSEALAALSVSGSSVTLATAADPATSIPVTLTLATDRKSITVKPASSLAKATSHLLTITAGVTDEAGNGLAAPYQLRFATDGTAPRVTGASIADGTSNLPLNPAITIAFSETMWPASLNGGSVLLTAVSDPNTAIPVLLTVGGDRASVTVKPAAALNKAASYLLTLTAAVTDDAGNGLAAPYQLRFATDGTAPTVTAASIADHTGNLPLNPSFTLTFSEPLAAASVNGGTLLLAAVSEPNSALPVNLGMSADRRSVTVKPASGLVKATSYLITATAGVTDEVGNGLAVPYTLNFATDGTPPAVVATSVPNNAANVPLNAAITITFNEPLAVASVNDATVFLAGAADPNAKIAISHVLSADRKTITVKPAANLLKGTSYVITATGGVTDDAGNGSASPYQLAFSTDAAAPAVVSASIADGAGNLPVNPSITITFSEPLAMASVTNSTLLLAPASAGSSGIPLVFTFSADHRAITVKSAANLVKATSYVITVTTSVTDEAGNFPDAPYHLNFTTDGTPPAVTATSIPDNSGNLPLNPAFTFSFSEPLAAASVTGANVWLSPAADAAVKIAVNLSVAADRRSITVTPGANLVKATSYLLTLTGGVTDEAGNGLAAPYTLTFATDNTPPAVTATSIPTGSGNLPLSPSFTFSFSEPLAAGSVTGQTVTLTTTADPDAKVPVTLTVAADHRSMMVKSASSLVKATSYLLTLTGGVTDEAGNGLTAPYQFTFTTDGMPLAVSGSSIADNSRNLPLNPAVTLSFSEPLAAASVTSSTVWLTAAADPTARMPVTLSVSSSRTSLTVRPVNSLVKATAYLLTLDSGVTDEAGNGLAAPYTLTFTTDDTPPAVKAVAPANGAQNAPVETAITFTFAEPIDPGSVKPDTILLASSFGPVQGNVTVSGDNLSLTFRPSGALSHNRDYTATLKAGMTDAAGNAATADYSYIFRTRSAGSDLAGLWKMDGDWSDSSGNGNTGAAYNGTSFTTDKVAGSASGYFAGTGYLAVPAAASLQPATAVTVEAWVNPADTTTNHQVVAKRYADSADPYNSYILAANSAGRWNFCVSNGTAGSQSCVVSPDPVIGDRWSHLVGAYNGQQLNIYVNGQLKGSVAKSGAIGYSAQPLFIGTSSPAAGQYFRGLIDEVAIYNRELPLEDILEHYNAGLTGDGVPPAPPQLDPLPASTYTGTVMLSGTKDADSSIRVDGVQLVAIDSATAWRAPWSLQPGQNVLEITSRDAAGNTSDPATVSIDLLPARESDPDIVGLWHLDGSWNDYSGNGNHGTPNSGASLAAGGVAGAGSGSFDGINGSVQVPDAAGLRLTGDFTLRFWMKKNSEAGDWQRIIGKGSTVSRNYGVWAEPGGKRLLFQQYNGSGAGILSLYSATRLETGNWYQVAAVVRGNDAYLYVNGKLDAQGTRTGTPAVSGDPLTIGYAGYGAWYPGSIDEVVIYKRALTADEILSHYGAVPRVGVTVPDQSAKYKPGETVTATVTAKDDAGVTGVSCSASGAATGALAISVDPAQGEVTREFAFQVAANAAPNAAITVTCSAGDEWRNTGNASLLLTVADTVHPAVTAASVPDNSGNLPLDPSFTLSFSERMATGSITESTATLTTAADPQTLIPLTITFSVDRKSITFKPTARLAKGTSYVLTLTTGVTDETGNGLAAPYILNFATDGTAPTVTASSIADGTSNLPLNPAVTLTFSEALASGSVTGATVLLASAADPNTAIPVTLTISPDRKWITCRPSANLAKGTSYLLRVTSAVTDDAGNGLATPYLLHFATDGTAPAVTATSVAEGASNLPLGSSFTLTFSEPLATASVTGATLFLTTAADLNYHIPVTLTVASDRRSVTVKPVANLQKATSYVLTATTGVTDDAGNGLAAQYLLRFATDGTPPAVNSVSPAAGSLDVPVGTAVTVVFGEPVDPASVKADTIVMSSSLGTVPGSVTVSADRLTVTFKPYNQLGTTRTYTYTLKAGVRDVSGNATTADLSASFTTQGADTAMVGYWPMDGDWKDYSGKGNHATANNDATFSTDHMVGTTAGSFQGSSDYLAVGNLYGKFPDNAFTIEAWAKLDNTGGGGRVTIAGATGATSDYAIGLHDNQFTVFTGNKSTLFYANSGFTPETGKWYHIAGTFDGSRLQLYVNGEIESDVPASWVQSASGADFWIGSEYCCGGNNFNGLIDDVSLYKRAIPPEDIFEHYNAGLTINRTQPAPPTVESVATPTYNSQVLLRGKKVAGTSIRINGKQVAAHDANTTWQVLYPLALGQNLLDVTSRDLAGNASDPVTVVIDVMPNNNPVEAAPQVGITSPGESVRYKAGEAGTSTVTASHDQGISRLVCNASGAAGEGTLSVSFDPPQTLVEREFAFRVMDDAAPSASIRLFCVAETAMGTLGSRYIYIVAADFVPPATPTLSVPANADLIKGNTVPVTAAIAHDDKDVALVDFYVDEQKVGSVTKAPYTQQITLDKEGVVRVKAIAQDQAGNRSSAAFLDLQVLADMPPQVAITTPAEGSSINTGASFTVTVQSSDDLGAREITLTASGEITFSQTRTNATGKTFTTSFTLTAPATISKGGAIQLTAVAKDSAGALSQTVRNLVLHDSVIPTIALASPGQTVKYKPGETADVTVTGGDNVGVTRIACAASGAATASQTFDMAATPSATVDFIFAVPTGAGPNSTITVSCTASDAAGNSKSSLINLTVADVVPPTVVSASPAGSAVNVPISASVTLSFSEPLAAATVNAGSVKLTETASGVAVSATVSISSDLKTVTIKPSAVLARGVGYTVTVTSAVTDQVGNPMVPYTTGFTSDGAPPAVKSAAPAAGSINASVGTSVTITFEETIDPSSVKSDTIALASSFGPVQGTVTVSADNTAVIFKPLGSLSNNRDYTVTLKAGVKDVSGNTTTGDYSYSFRTQGASSDLVGLWHMDGDWSDSSGNGNHGTANGGVTFGSDYKVGTAAGSFDGVNDYVNVPYNSANPLFSLDTQFTYELWVKPNTSGPLIQRQQCINAWPVADLGIGGSAPDFDVTLTLNYSNSNTHTTFTAPKTVNQGVWTHIAATYDKSSQSVKVYVNGKNVYSGAYSQSIWKPTTPLWIGGIPKPSSGCWESYLNGPIDEVAIYDALAKTNYAA